MIANARNLNDLNRKRLLAYLHWLHIKELASHLSYRRGAGVRCHWVGLRFHWI